MALNRPEAARNASKHYLETYGLSRADRKTAEELARIYLEGGKQPAASAYLKRIAREAAEHGAEHAYGNNIPEAIRRRLG